MPTDFHAVGLPGTFSASSEATPATSVAFTEGPAAARDGSVYFSDIANNRILRFCPNTGAHAVWRTPSGRANGLLFDPQERLLVCEGNEMGDNDGGRRVTRTDLKTGALTVLTDTFAGCRYNAPNDICACSNGSIFFTDPCYGDRSTMETEHESVYRIAADGSVTRAISQPDIQRPNGIALSPDETVLYVVDSCPTTGGNRKIWSFDLHSDGRLSNQKTVIDFAPGRGGDGMAVDQEGSLYIAAGIHRPRGPHETATVPPGIWIVGADGDLRGRIPIPEDVLTNVTFGGPELKTLYVTAGKTLYQVPVPIAGCVIHRRA